MVIDNNKHIVLNVMEQSNLSRPLQCYDVVLEGLGFKP